MIDKPSIECQKELLTGAGSSEATDGDVQSDS